MTDFSSTDNVILYITGLVFAIVAIFVLIYIFFYRKKSELLLERQKKQTQFEQELSMAIAEMKETTLSYIGQELHDDLGQKMSVAKLMINHGLEDENGNQKEILTEINEIIGESIRDIRSLSKSFITEQIENLGLIKSIQREVSRIDRLNLMKINFEHNIEDTDIEAKDGLILFRIVQESINNSLKHSRAKTMNIDLLDLPNFIEIILKDNGIGFEKNSNSKGSGLISMQKRAKLINTDFQIKTATGNGTEIRIKYNKN
ncbi:sensor histidine kinase [Frigoriflavimonas asaccharolytica]|uniref:histidine kinase n=1 Tax=Frigoriflavimonas asaccharolytica TaxID=2735899 RepID=A0A8J8G6G1_9FLAO|nr:histidine kinase [Frigoriflavimonas asaccharolytica]NRS92018.1 signal transduction histidine kinase [Frigoriflavimonas asaccharolytica]